MREIGFLIDLLELAAPSNSALVSCQRSRSELHIRRLEGREERALVGRVQRDGRRRAGVRAQQIVHGE